MSFVKIGPYWVHGRHHNLSEIWLTCCGAEQNLDRKYGLTGVEAQLISLDSLSRRIAKKGSE